MERTRKSIRCKVYVGLCAVLPQSMDNFYLLEDFRSLARDTHNDPPTPGVVLCEGESLKEAVSNHPSSVGICL